MPEPGSTDSVRSDRDEAVRGDLEGEATQLRERITELETDESPLAYDEGFADSGQVAAEQGENLALAAQLREQLDDIERALTKLDEGTYGLCEVCGQPISEARLEAIPAARFCIDHAD